MSAVITRVLKTACCSSACECSDEVLRHLVGYECLVVAAVGHSRTHDGFI